MKDSIMNLLVSFGFEIVDGPEIETEEFNFDMLNIKKSHPARQMHDTFYIENKSNLKIEMSDVLNQTFSIVNIDDKIIIKKDDLKIFFRGKYPIEVIGYTVFGWSYSKKKDIYWRTDYSVPSKFLNKFLWLDLCFDS